MNSTSTGVSLNRSIELATCPTGSITINDVEEIPSYAYDQCQSLTSVTIGNSVKVIGSFAFHQCDYVTSITIGNSVTTIGGAAFRNCLRLRSITIPDSVVSIADAICWSCVSLTSVSIGKSVRSIDFAAFAACPALTQITVSPENEHFVTKSNVLFNRNCSNLFQFPGKVSGSYTIPDTVVTIKPYAFCFCMYLTSVTIPASVIWIEEFAFFRCNSVKTFTIPDSVTWLGCSSFSGCEILTSVIIPGSVTWLGEKAFYGSTKLTNVVFRGVNPPDYYPDALEYTGVSSVAVLSGYTGTDFCGVSVSKGSALTCPVGSHTVTKKVSVSEFQGCNSLTSVTLADSITAINDYAFFECQSLVSVTIPDSVTTIGDSAFYKCVQLIDVAFMGKTDVSSGAGVFEFCPDSMKIRVVDDYTGSSFCGANIVKERSLMSYDNSTLLRVSTFIVEYSIPESVTCISSSAFQNCINLASVVIPSFITSIGNGAFSSCWSLTSVTINSTEFVENFKTIFPTYQRITEVIFGTNITRIGNSAFSSFTSLYFVNIPSSVTSIGDSAFSDCHNLRTVSVFGTASIGDKAFAKCDTMKEFVAHADLTFVGSDAFWLCSSLSTFTYEGTTAPEYGDGVFEGCVSLEKINVPGVYNSEYFCGKQTTKYVETVETSKETEMEKSTQGWFVDNVGWLAPSFSFLVTGLTLLLKFDDIKKWCITRCHPHSKKRLSYVYDPELSDTLGRDLV